MYVSHMYHIMYHSCITLCIIHVSYMYQLCITSVSCGVWPMCISHSIMYVSYVYHEFLLALYPGWQRLRINDVSSTYHKPDEGADTCMIRNSGHAGASAEAWSTGREMIRKTLESVYQRCIESAYHLGINESRTRVSCAVSSSVSSDSGRWWYRLATSSQGTATCSRCRATSSARAYQRACTNDVSCRVSCPVS